MQTKKVHLPHEIYSAKNNLYTAKRAAETGEGHNLIPDRLSSALLWAMEAWLLTHKIEVNQGLGWRGTREAFQKYAPEDIKNEVLTCLGKTTTLEYFLYGSNSGDEYEKLPSMTEWREMAAEWTEKTASAIELIKQNL